MRESGEDQKVDHNKKSSVDGWHGNQTEMNACY